MAFNPKDYPNPAGRKTTCTPGVIKLALEYVSDDPKKNYLRYDHAIPSIVGMARVLKRSRATLYTWAKDPENTFHDILAENNEFQELVTINGTLKGELNAQIGKLVLGKHGYHDRQEVEVKDTTPPSAEKRKSRITELFGKCKT